MPDLVQVIVLVDDLGHARAEMEDIGLDVHAGGRHPGRGTENLIVPFGDQYLELLAIVDPDEAARTPAGRAVAAAWEERGPGLARWSVEDPDIAHTAFRLGMHSDRRERLRPDGVMVRWEAIAVDLCWSEPWRCAFMSWPDPGHMPGRVPARHPCGATGFAELEIGVPSDAALAAWVGGPLPAGVRCVEGDPFGPRTVALRTPEGPLTLG